MRQDRAKAVLGIGCVCFQSVKAFNRLPGSHRINMQAVQQCDRRDLSCTAACLRIRCSLNEQGRHNACFAVEAPSNMPLLLWHACSTVARLPRTQALSMQQRPLIPQQHRHVCTAAHTLATHACRHIAIFPMTRQATQLQQAPCRPCWGRLSKQGGLCAAVHTPQLVLAAVLAQTGLLLRLRRADALGARLRQLVGRGRRGRQHRLNLVQARPVLTGHEDALGRRVVRDACRVTRASCIQTEIQYLPVTKMRLVAGSYAMPAAH